MSSTGSHEQRGRTRFSRERSDYDDGGSGETRRYKLRHGARAGNRAPSQAAHCVRERRHGRNRYGGVTAPGAKRGQGRCGLLEIGRASGRGRGEISVGAVLLKKKKMMMV